MFLHLGADVIVQLEDVIAVLNMRARETSAGTREFLQLAEAENRLVNIAAGTAKSFVLVGDRVYLSPISPGTLRKRAGIPPSLTGEG